MPIGIGIDLGTTTSEIAWFDEELGMKEAASINIDGYNIVPSVVWLDQERERIVVGRTAQENQINYPDRIVSSVKRQMGKTAEQLKDESVGDKKLPMEYRTKNPAKVQFFGPTEISAEILKYIKAKASEAMPGQLPVKDVVVTVPADFTVLQKRAAVEAIRMAGLNLSMLLSEPVAALIACRDFEQTQDQKVFVFDLGGGTLDCTIIEINGSENRVRAKSGGMDIAGDRIDKILFDQIVGRIEKDKRIDLRADSPSTRYARQLIMTSARRLKERLSAPDVDTEIFTVSNVEYAEGKQFSFDMPMRRTEFEAAITDIINMNENRVIQALDQAGFRRQDIDKVILVGGSTRIPMVRRMLEKHFAKEQIFSDASPELVVAQGAAIASYWLQKHAPIVMDTVTHTLGMRDLSSYAFDLLIERGQSLTRAVVQKKIVLTSAQNSIGIDLYEVDNSVAGTKTVQTIEEKDAEGKDCCLYAGTWEVAAPEALPARSELNLTIKYDPVTSLPVVNASTPQGALETRSVLTRASVAVGLRTERRSEVDLVFVVDTTGSMRHSSHWQYVKSALGESAKQLVQKPWNIRFGLTTFGRLHPGKRDDYYAGQGDRINSADLTASEPEFVGTDLARLEDWHAEGGDDAESCLDALLEAAGSGMRTGDNVRRILVLITDSGSPAPPARENETLETILNNLRQRRITVYTIAPMHTAYQRLSSETQGKWLEIDEGDLRQSLKAIVSDLMSKPLARA